MSGCGYPCSQRSATGRLIRVAWSGSLWPLSSVMAALPALATAPGYARGHVRAALTAWGISEFAEAAQLVVSELVTNAVRASEQPSQSISDEDGQTPVIGICLLADGTRLRIEISDPAAGFPVLRRASADSECGRGLALVDALTEGRWGWHPAARAAVTKYVWAEIGQPISEAQRATLTFALRHPNPENGGRNMTTTGIKLAPSPATGVKAIATAAPVIIAAMRDAGLPVDPDLWVPRAQCSQCYQGCADDPKGA